MLEEQKQIEMRVRRDREKARMAPVEVGLPKWHIAECYEGGEFRCEDLVKEKFGYETMVLEGLRATCKKKTWPDVTLENFAVYPGYVFIRFTHYPNWIHFTNSIKARRLIVRDGAPYVVPDEVIYELHKEQATGVHSNWLAKPP